jgi:hypothetical protein
MMQRGFSRKEAQENAKKGKTVWAYPGLRFSFCARFSTFLRLKFPRDAGWVLGRLVAGLR